jgi:hypothetical protein
MDESLVQLVWERAGATCEYCGMKQTFSLLPFEIDHIIAQKHGGKTIASNLALSCFYDNSFKGPNVAGVDPRTGRLSRLFHPRRHQWRHHFRWDGAYLVGRTAIGRATIEVLRINHPLRVAQREALIDAGLFPTIGQA